MRHHKPFPLFKSCKYQTDYAFVKSQQSKEGSRKERNVILYIIQTKSWDSTVSIVTVLWAGQLRGKGSRPSRVKNFLLSMSSRLALGTIQPPVQRVPGGSLSQVVSGRGMMLTNHLQLCRGQEKVDLYIHPPQYSFMAYCLVKHRDNYTSHFYIIQTYSYILTEQKSKWA
jgi:hypothetical protein